MQPFCPGKTFIVLNLYYDSEKGFGAFFSSTIFHLIGRSEYGTLLRVEMFARPDCCPTSNSSLCTYVLVEDLNV